MKNQNIHKIHIVKNKKLEFPIRIIKMKTGENIIAKTEIADVKINENISRVVIIRTPFLMEHMTNKGPSTLFRNWVPYSSEETFFLEMKDILLIALPNNKAIEGYNQLVLLDNMDYYGDEFNDLLLNYYQKNNIQISLNNHINEDDDIEGEDTYFSGDDLLEE